MPIVPFPSSAAPWHITLSIGDGVLGCIGLSDKATVFVNDTEDGPSHPTQMISRELGTQIVKTNACFISSLQSRCDVFESVVNVCEIRYAGTDPFTQA